jgi:Tol biopolymer transport system component
VPERWGLGVGDSLALGASFIDDAGRSLGPATGVSWASLSPNVAQVTQAGTVTAVGVGRGEIAVTAPWGRGDTAVVFVAGRLVFTSTRAGSADLWTIDPDAPERLRQVTRETATETNGSFSPDGASIAYVANPDGHFDIYLANADGSDPRRLTSTPETELTPRYTRDGRAVIYSAPPAGGGRAQVWIVSLDGSAPRRLTSGDATNVDPAPSPDGRSIAFTSTRDGNYQIYVMGLDGGDQRRAHTSALKETRPAWFPNGDLAYLQERGGGGHISSVVMRQPAAGGEAVGLTPVGLAVTDFAISAAGDLLALEVSSFGPGGGLVTRLVAFPLDGRAPFDLPRQSDAELQSRPAFRPPAQQ